MRKRESWHTDAQNVDPAEIGDIIFCNATVRQFLDMNSKNFVIACKGIGKTLLLKYKRFLLDKHFCSSDEGSSISFIPHSTPYLDFVTDFGSLRKGTINIMESLGISRKLWTVAIMISALSEYNSKTQETSHSYDSELNELKKRYDQKYKRYIELFTEGRSCAPCYVLRLMLTTMQRQTIMRFLDEFYPVIEELFRSVHSGIFIFIDRVDQALRPYGKNVWIHFQAGLVEAAWDVMRINNHVKIFTSIRQEAWLSYTSSNKEAIKGNVSIIRYSHQDLLNISNHHCLYYEDVRTVYDFLGFKEILNAFSGIKEDSFNYIERHTIGRPRDLMTIFSAISPYRKEMSNDYFRDIVNTSSNIDIGKNVFDELVFLFHSLDSKEKQDVFFSLIPQNILSIEMMKDICREYNDMSSCHDQNCKLCDAGHVFCDLYNTGFLGVIKDDTNKDTPKNVKIQKFLGPYDLRSYDKGGLPPSENFYLIHPCLQSCIEDIRYRMTGKSYNLVENILIGHNYYWYKKYTYFVYIYNYLHEIPDNSIREQFRSLIYDVSRGADKNVVEDKFKRIDDMLDKSAKRIINLTKIWGFVEKIYSLM